MMRTADRVVLLLGQMIRLLSEAPDETDDLKAALRTLTEITDKRSLSIRAEADHITVEGIDVEGDSTLIGLLLQQMQAHLVAEMRIAHGASAIDIMHLVRGIAHNLSDYGPGHIVDAHLQNVGATTVSAVSTAADASRQHRRDMRITDALEATGLSLDQPGRPQTSTPTAEPTQPGESPSPAGTLAHGAAAKQEEEEEEEEEEEKEEEEEIGLVSEHTGQAYDDMLRQLLASTGTMSEAISKLEADAPSAELFKQLDTVQGSITKALDKHQLDQAIDAVAALVRKEAESTKEDSRRAYGVALRRLLTEHHMTMFAAYLLDDLYAADVVLIIRRAGKPGTRVILELLVKAPTFAERKAYLRLLREVEEGLDAITGMLAHPDWFVIRNMADLAGELRIQEAIPALGKMMAHSDDRVRVAVGVALARIGVSASVPYLSKVPQDPDPKVRAIVFQEIGGRGLSALAMPLVAAMEGEENPQVRAEYLRALGRIGTPEAVEALKKAAGEKTGLLKRKASTDSLAAVEGLVLANSSNSMEALKALKTGGSKDVRDAASKALRGTIT